MQNPQRVDWVVTVDFDSAGSDAFGELSAAAACAEGDPRRIAIVLDDEIISSPEVQVPCGGRITDTTEISGNFNNAEATELAILIEGGALPVPVEVIEQRTVGPTLGAAAIEASWQAALVGLLLTALFIAIVYRLVGFLATLALSSYALLAYAMLVGLGSTLTLPGLAGFVLAIGLAIDANVLVFERAREEYAANPSAGCVGPWRPASTRRGPRSSTPTSPPCSRPGCCSSWAPARSRASASRCRSVSSPR